MIIQFNENISNILQAKKKKSMGHVIRIFSVIVTIEYVCTMKKVKFRFGVTLWFVTNFTVPVEK